jgi:hypothetical protein
MDRPSRLLHLAVVGALTLLAGGPATTVAAFAQAAAATTVAVPDGDSMLVALQSDVGTRTAHVGMRFVVLTTDDYSVGGALVLPKGSPGYGVVTDVKRAEKPHKNGTIAFTVSQFVAPSGAVVATRVTGNTADIEFSKEVNGSAIGAWAAFGVVGLAAMRGYDYVAKAGSRFHVLTVAQASAPVCAVGSLPAKVDDARAEPSPQPGAQHNR